MGFQAKNREIIKSQKDHFIPQLKENKHFLSNLSILVQNIRQYLLLHVDNSITLLKNVINWVNADNETLTPFHSQLCLLALAVRFFEVNYAAIYAAIYAEICIFRLEIQIPSSKFFKLHLNRFIQACKISKNIYCFIIIRLYYQECNKIGNQCNSILSKQ